MAQQWEVVGDTGRGGILVREGMAKDSRELPDKLATGARVEEVDLAGVRLHYKKVSGNGPDEGWVSTAVGDKFLLTKVVVATPGAEAAGADAATPAPRLQGPPPPRQLQGPQATSDKRSPSCDVPVQLVGAAGVGKTKMLETLLKAEAQAQLGEFHEQEPSPMSHHTIQIGEKLIQLFDCSGNARPKQLAREDWVFVVYDLANAKSWDDALELAKNVRQAGAKLLLLGNKHNVERGQGVDVDVKRVKVAAWCHGGMEIETSHLIDAINLALVADEVKGPAPEGADGDNSAATAVASVKSGGGGTADRSSGPVGHENCLRPSLLGTRAMKAFRRESEMLEDLKVVEEHDVTSPITCMVFGQERHHNDYILLAAGSERGTAEVYRCQRTAMELAMLGDPASPMDDTLPPHPTDSSHPTRFGFHVQHRLMGHTRAITSIVFNELEDQLVTASIDESVRFWSVDSGEMLKVFEFSSPVPVARLLPSNPEVVAAASSRGSLRLVDVTNGMVLQTLRVRTDRKAAGEIHALTFDQSGMFLIAGTKCGSIIALMCSEDQLQLKFQIQLARGGITWIHAIPGRDGMPPALLVNSSDSSVAVVDMTYGPPPGTELTNLAVRHSVSVQHKLLPLKCAYSPSAQGYLISGSEDKDVHIFALGTGQNYKRHTLKHHTAPVVAVAVNHQDTLLASADSLGRIALWRRVDFSHLPD